jgi:flagellar basal body-associated protein FliL
MKEQLTGKKCIELKIVYFNSDPDAATNEVKEYYLPYLKSEILEILEQKKNK